MTLRLTLVCIFLVCCCLLAILQSSNFLEEIPDYAFVDGFESVGSIALADNKLTSLEVVDFLGLPNMKKLDVSQNAIEYMEEGLLDYWREWGFSDYCRPEGDSFTCD